MGYALLFRGILARLAGRFWLNRRPSGSNPLHLSRGTARRPASGLFRAARLATNLPLFTRRLQLPVLVNVRSVRPRLCSTIQGEELFRTDVPKSRETAFAFIRNPPRQAAGDFSEIPTIRPMGRCHGQLRREICQRENSVASRMLGLPMIDQMNCRGTHRG